MAAGGGVEGQLKAIIASGSIPPDLIVTYDDMHGLWGGTTLVVRGNDRAQRRERGRGDATAKVVERAVSRSQLFELVALLVKIRAWEQQTPERRPVPDESRATLSISVRGQKSTIWEWFNDLPKNKRLARVKAKMDAVMAVR
jgi:hypothetical protein